MAIEIYIYWTNDQFYKNQFTITAIDTNMDILIKENLITKFSDAIGLSISSVEIVDLDEFDDRITLTLIRFSNGKFLMQRDQDSWTTMSGLMNEYNFEAHLKLFYGKR